MRPIDLSTPIGSWNRTTMRFVLNGVRPPDRYEVRMTVLDESCM